MSEKREVQFSGASIMASLITAVLILTLSPLMLGFIGSEGAIASIIWGVPGFVLIVVAIIGLLQDGDPIGAAVNAVLTGMALCQTMGRGFIFLSFILTGRDIPISLVKAFDQISGGGFLVSGIFLFVMAVINIKSGNRPAGCFILMPSVGFCFLGLGSFGASALTFPGFVLLDAFGVYMLYQSICEVLVLVRIKD